jgi:hypothetical protein
MRDKPISLERMLQMDYGRKGSVEEKKTTLFVGLKGLGVK